MLASEIYGQTLRYFLAPVADLLFKDDSITEVMINGPKQIYCERGGRIEKTNCEFADDEALLAAVRNIAEYVGRRLDQDHHSMDARLPDPERFRVHVITPPCSSKQGIVVTIRKFRRSNVTLEWLMQMGSLTPMAAEVLELMVKAHRNLIVSGGTGSGKTSLLNALSAAIPPHERIIVIEDTSELQLHQPHTVYLEAQGARPDGKGAVSIRDLFVDSLRMRPDRILVGEVRRGEALDLVQSMLSGHDGSLSTVHASSPTLALVRLETLCLMNDVKMPVYVARQQVSSAIQVIVQIARMSDGSRRVIRIAEVRGLSPKRFYRVKELFRFHIDGVEQGRIQGSLRPTGRRCSFAREVLESEHAGQIKHSLSFWRPKAGSSSDGAAAG